VITEDFEPQLKASRSFAWWAFFLKFRFAAFHVMALVGTLYFGVTAEAAACCAVLYFVRMFGVTAGYHRYFSHKAFKTSRPFAFFLALLAQSSGQRGAIWWARNHRHHHRYSDKKEDIHSAKHHGFWQSHCGWIFMPEAYTHQNTVSDLERHRELLFLERYPMTPAIALALAVYALLGPSGFFFGFCMSTVLLFHGTFTINSITHMWGSRRFDTGDDSRNNLLLAMITLGEGWHNNHHRYMRSARQGFYWWELDITFYMLKMLSWMGLVWDLRPVPEHILEEAS
jgi:stearoyl-CoA desaturase (Delta-9 desaturase)